MPLNPTPITQEGQPCRHCGTPVIKRTHKPGWKPKQFQPYYFEWWFKCPHCKALYMQETAKRLLRVHKPEEEPLFNEQWRLEFEKWAV